jgi:hypothetical protein
MDEVDFQPKNAIEQALLRQLTLKACERKAKQGKAQNPSGAPKSKRL